MSIRLFYLMRSPALRIPTIQTSSTPVHNDERLGIALVAHRGRRRETRAVSGDGDVLFVVGGGVGGQRTLIRPAGTFSRRRRNRLAHFTVFF